MNTKCSTLLTSSEQNFVPYLFCMKYLFYTIFKYLILDLIWETYQPLPHVPDNAGPSDLGGVILRLYI